MTIETVSLNAAIEMWLNGSNLSAETRKQYKRYVGDMKKRGLIPSVSSDGSNNPWQEIRHAVHQANIDDMNQMPEWAESTRRLRISCYISLMKFLSRMSGDWFKEPTVTEYSAYYVAQYSRIEKALTFEEWQKFLKELRALDQRDSLIARCLLRNSALGPVLDLRLRQVNLSNNTITFRKESGRSVITHYPESFMQELKQYIDSTADARSDLDWVFVTRSGKKVVRSRLNYSFLRASEKAQIKKVTPYTLRATYTMLVRGSERVDERLLLCV